MRPLLVHHSRRIGQHPVVKLGMEPSHREGRRSARADAHCRPPVRIFGEFHARVALNQRQHFVLDELCVSPRDRVVFEPSFAALSVLAARADKDCDHRRHAMRVDQVIENREELLFIVKAVRAAIAEDNERSFASRDVTSRNIDVDGPVPYSCMGGRHQKVRLVPGRGLPGVDRRIEAAVGIITDQTGIEDGALIRRHREGIDLARGRSVLSGELRRWRMCRPNDKIAFRLAWGKRSVRQFGRGRIVGILRVASRRQGFEIEARRVDVERRRWIGGVGAWGNSGVSFQAIGVRRACDAQAAEGCNSEHVHDWRSPLIVVLS
jgi:hypothetical protein